MLKDIFFALWFFLPAGFANMMPVFAAHIGPLKRYDYPMDFHIRLRGKRLFGDHKTLRGLLAGVVFSTLILAGQQWLVGHSPTIAGLTDQVDYTALPVLVLGPLFGLGALLGDAIESCLKRQRGIRPGEGWFPFDQTDYIIGGAIATAPFVQLSLLQYVVLITIWLGLHVIATFIGYKVGLRDKPI